MLHKGKLHAALQLKKGQFGLYDGTFSEQLSEYRTALETLHLRFPSSTHMERVLPPAEHNMAAGARPTIEFDRWLASVDGGGLDIITSYYLSPGEGAERVSVPTALPMVPFGREFANHEQARLWAECIEGITTLAVDGSQLQPWRDASIPVALVQVGFFANPHMRGKPYTKDVRLEVLAPEEIMEESKAENKDPDSYPYSDMQVTLRRYMLEIETLCMQMEHFAQARRAGDPDTLSGYPLQGRGNEVISPVVFFDGSLVVSFALTMPSPYRERYIAAAVSLLRTSEEQRVPLIGYIDTSYARDVITMLRRLDIASPHPTLHDTKRIHDALLWKDRLKWGDRTPAMICARGDILQDYGEYRESVAFCYLQTSMGQSPARLEFPRWLLDEGILEPVMDVVRAEVIAGGNGYPYAIETADAVSVISMQDRAEFYAQFQDFIEQQGLKFTFSRKAASKSRRR